MLKARYRKKWPDTPWYGPYFAVDHQHNEYNPKIYRDLRDMGYHWNIANTMALWKTIHDGSCYFGKTYPGPEDVSHLTHVPPEKKEGWPPRPSKLGAVYAGRR